MKKKLALMAITVAAVASMTACGAKKDKEVEETVSVEATTQDSTEEAKDSNYIPIQDLVIEDYITLADYKGITINASKEEVQEDYIETYINTSVLVPYPVTDRAVANGDLVTIDFEGKKDGVAFEGGTSKGYQLAIGSGTFIPGFEDALVGVKPGETKDIKLTFPEEYPSEELKGQEVVFTVTVHNILIETDYQSVTPEQLELMNLSYKTKEELWEAGRKELEEEAESQYESEIRIALIQKLVDMSTFNELPKHLVDEQVQNYNEYITNIAKNYYGMEFDAFVEAQGMSVEDFSATVVSMSEEQVRMQLVVEAIAKAEGITVTEDDIRAKFNNPEQYGFESVDEMIDSIGLASLRTDLVTERVIEKVKDSLKIEPATSEE